MNTPSNTKSTGASSPKFSAPYPTQFDRSRLTPIAQSAGVHVGLRIFVVALWVYLVVTLGRAGISYYNNQSTFRMLLLEAGLNLLLLLPAFLGGAYFVAFGRVEESLYADLKARAGADWGAGPWRWLVQLFALPFVLAAWALLSSTALVLLFGLSHPAWMMTLAVSLALGLGYGLWVHRRIKAARVPGIVGSEIWPTPLSALLDLWQQLKTNDAKATPGRLAFRIASTLLVCVVVIYFSLNLKYLWLAVPLSLVAAGLLWRMRSNYLTLRNRVGMGWHTSLWRKLLWSNIVWALLFIVVSQLGTALKEILNPPATPALEQVQIWIIGCCFGMAVLLPLLYSLESHLQANLGAWANLIEQIAVRETISHLFITLAIQIPFGALGVWSGTRTSIRFMADLTAIAPMLLVLAIAFLLAKQRVRLLSAERTA